MERKASTYRVEAVDRALVLLSLLAERGRLSVTEAGRELGVVPSTAHRLLATLCHRGFAVQGEDRVYQPGPQWLAGPRQVPPLTDRMRPHLRSLHAATNETVHLLARVGTEVSFLDGIEGARSLRVGLRTGVRMPAYRTSGGKAMLADLEPSAVDALHRGGLPSPPDASLTDLAALRRELDHVRRDGFGRNEDESEPGVTALGVSLGFVDGHHVALAVALPSVRAHSDRRGALVDELLLTCRQARQDLVGAGDGALRPATAVPDRRARAAGAPRERVDEGSRLPR
ncbi:IclR family transcriptional regulator [Streptomyces sp. H28]|uniref:IclR family transcriptional regulator n=1 Tax=Streptomyces sp. H28 TaxID=2775865 RepID=UPI00177A885A|nr:IclR family transcriptional regulator [Streptomyces sp. H28]MBD9731625.1 IclR family transcriptional regulator [Streptomyces sp. H28]